jgi:hypothetical protein
MKKKTVTGIVALSLLVVIAAMVLVAAVPENVVYIDPKDSSAPFCREKEVEIWANANDFYGGQINLMYDPTCANVTNWERNTTTFPLGGWVTLTDGEEWITFSALPPTALLTGEYMIGTLTIHCVNDSKEGCKTPIDFVEPSTLFDDGGNPVPANFIDGTFECRRTPVILDTGPGDYPSIFGTHNGTITLNQTISVSKLYTYPCTGTGGHTEYIRLWNSSGLNVTAKWRGYAEDWHNVSFDTSFELKQGALYNYTIRTGSYPQIIHEHAYNATGGTITCTKFTDANGKIYSNRIPAIRLFR